MEIIIYLALNPFLVTTHIAFQLTTSFHIKSLPLAKQRYSNVCIISAPIPFAVQIKSDCSLDLGCIQTLLNAHKIQLPGKHFGITQSLVRYLCA